MDLFFSTTDLRTSKKRKAEMTAINENSPKRPRGENGKALNDLPNEILIEILTHLDAQSMLSATLVCKRWNSLTYLKTTTNKIQLYIDEVKTSNESYPILTRPYKSIRFEDITEWKPELMELLRKIGNEVTEISLTQCVFFYEEFELFLELFPNIEALELNYCHPGLSPEREEDEEREIEMKYLRSLIVRGYSWPLRNISSPNLNFLAAECLMLYDQRDLISFLNEQKSLEKLHLMDNRDLFDSRYGTLENSKFKLKEIVLINLPFVDGTQLTRLLKCNRTTIESVDIGIEITQYITEYVLLNFHQIKHLSIDYEILPSSVSFYDHMIVNNNLKFLKFYGDAKSSRNLRRFLAKYPKLETLDLSFLRGLHPFKYEFWRKLATLVPNLRELSIRRLNMYNMGYLTFKHLKHLDVEYMGFATEKIWRDFCKDNSGLESLHIYGTYMKCIDRDIEVIIRRNLPNIKHFCASN